MNLTNETMIHQKNGEIEYLQFRKLLEYKEITHCYTLKPLDFIKTKTPEEHYQKLCHALKIDPKHIIIPQQNHTNFVQTIQTGEENLQDVDGVITNQNDQILATKNADCILILLYDPNKKVIGNIHSGWRGVASKIIQKAIEQMKVKYFSEPKDIICCISPSIRKCHFEVKEDVKQIFETAFQYTDRIHEIIEINEKKEIYLIDLVLATKIMLIEKGIQSSNIIDSNICSVCHHTQIHSVRVDKEKAGRGTAIITKNEMTLETQ